MIKPIREVKIRMVRHQPDLSKDVDDIVKQQWQRGEELGKKNGQITAVRDCSVISGVAHITAFATQYKYFWAQQQDPELGALVEPLAVSGAVRDANMQYLVGQRSNTVTQYAGCWEFAPSGGLMPKEALSEDAAELALRREFKEELTIGENTISRVTPIGLLFDSKDHVYNIAQLIDLYIVFPDQPLLHQDDYTEQTTLALVDVVKLTPAVPTMMQIYDLLR